MTRQTRKDRNATNDDALTFALANLKLLGMGYDQPISRKEAGLISFHAAELQAVIERATGHIAGGQVDEAVTLLRRHCSAQTLEAIDRDVAMDRRFRQSDRPSYGHRPD